MEKDSAEKLRTIRHRENKRRYRARQREHVESLQQRLVNSRDQQVAGMREVQLAAQKVVLDNTRLRTLLRCTGVDDTVVESWLHGDETLARQLLIRDAISSHSSVSNGTGSSNVSNRSTQTSSDTQHLPLPSGLCARCSSLGPATSLPSEGAMSVQDRSHSSTPENSEESRPCMSVSHILINANPDSGSVADLAPGEGDIECSMAQKMVLPFATSNDKVEAITKKLKEGCVMNQRGGCKVKANVMWEVLEDAITEA